jgi:integrase
VPLGVLAADILITLPRLEGEWLFPANSKTGQHYRNFTFAKAQLDEISGVTNWTLHDLRRTAATGMARIGVAPHVIERILNHRTGTLGGVAGIYNRFGYLDEMRAALERWEEYVKRFIEEDDRAPPLRGEGQKVV